MVCVLNSFFLTAMLCVDLLTNKKALLWYKDYLKPD